jgi:hypothetical protein
MWQWHTIHFLLTQYTNGTDLIFQWFYIYYFFETVNGFLPRGRGTTTTHKITHHEKESEQRYTNNKGHITPNEHNTLLQAYGGLYSCVIITLMWNVAALFSLKDET